MGQDGDGARRRWGETASTNRNGRQRTAPCAHRRRPKISYDTDGSPLNESARLHGRRQEERFYRQPLHSWLRRALHLTEEGKNREYPDENPSCYQNLSLDSLVHGLNVVYAKSTALA